MLCWRGQASSECGTLGSVKAMEITLDTIISIVGIFLGGGAGAFFTWKYQRRKAKAEANKEEQDYYQQMMKDLAADRDYYKQERNDLRTTIKSYNERMDLLERNQARQGRMIVAMRPFLCADLACKKRRLVTKSDIGEIDTEEGGEKEDANKDK